MTMQTKQNVSQTLTHTGWLGSVFLVIAQVGMKDVLVAHCVERHSHWLQKQWARHVTHLDTKTILIRIHVFRCFKPEPSKHGIWQQGDMCKP